MFIIHVYYVYYIYVYNKSAVFVGIMYNCTVLSKYYTVYIIYLQTQIKKF